MKCLDSWFEKFILFFLAFVVLVLFSYIAAHAQDVQPVQTMFSAGCVERLGDLHYRIHFGYVSDGEDLYTAQFIKPDGSAAFINTPEVVRTQPGVHDDWYLDAHVEDTAFVFSVIFTSQTNLATVSLNTWDVPPCADGQYGDYIPATPEPVIDDCPAWSRDSATGGIICLWDLPRVGDWQ